MDFILEGVDGSIQGNPLKSVIYQTNLNMLSQLCHIFDASLPIQIDDEPYENDFLECCFIEVRILYDKRYYERFIIDLPFQAIYLSLGATLIRNDLLVFDEFVKRYKRYLVLTCSLV